MKKLYLPIFCLLFTVSAAAQELEIPLFQDESIPNLGRNAKPLDSIVVTPSPLPEIRVSLDNAEAPSTNKSVLTPISEPAIKPTVEPKQPTSNRQIQLQQNRLNQKQADQMAEELQSQLDRARTTTNTPVVKNPSQPVQEQSAVTPTSIEDLFGTTHDVKTFDINGISLGMTPEDVIDAAEEAGYHVVDKSHKLPLFRTSYYEQRCRDAGVYLPKDIRHCIAEQAADDEVTFVSAMTLKRPATNETLYVYFSSQATENLVYKIVYVNKGDNSLNFTRKNLAKKLRRKEAFWNLMFDTYGLPDDNEKIIWGDPQKAYMQATMRGSAYDAYIVLEDKDIQDTDYFAAEDEAKELKYKHSFSFAGEQEED